MNEVLLYSAGIDSAITEYYLREVCGKENLVLVYYDIHSKYSDLEIATLKKRDKNVIFDNTFNFSDIEKSDAFVPNRNLQFAMNATKYGDVVYIGGTASDRVSDNNKEIMDQLSALLTSSLGRLIYVTSPFWDVYKCNLVSWYAPKIGTMDLLQNTFSCYNPLKIAREWNYVEINKDIDTSEFKPRYLTHECMACPACFRKAAALCSAGILVRMEDRSLYDHYWKELSKQIVLNPRWKNTKEYLSLATYSERSSWIGSGGTITIEDITEKAKSGEAVSVEDIQAALSLHDT